VPNCIIAINDCAAKIPTLASYLLTALRLNKEHYTISYMASVLPVQTFRETHEALISHLVIDSRRLIDPDESLFFAISAQRDGHLFLNDAYAKGVRNFVISDSNWLNTFADANVLLVEDVLRTLQLLASHNRKQHHLKVIGITGSNGKTIVKEWLYQLLANDFNVVKSPKSFNSQIGVALSLWEIENENNLGIFEAGISKPGEMDLLESMIQPSIGILTNIGAAHAEGFASDREKLEEKLKLFKDSEIFIYNPLYAVDLPKSALPRGKKISWSFTAQADLQVLNVNFIGDRTEITALINEEEIHCVLPFRDQASIENAIICWTTMLALGYQAGEAAGRLENLMIVRMRLELKNGINQCSIIDDSYSADISSLAIALDFLSLQNQHPQKTLILSDIYQTGKNKAALYTEISDLLAQKQVDRLIGIGEDIASFPELFKPNSSFYSCTADFIHAFPKLHFHNESILVKGARIFEFEKISKLLTQKIHDTVLEIDLNAVADNLKFYRSKLKPGVKVMAMVKAFSYGSGSFEIANVLQYQRVDYLAVAYADEGIALRKAGITLPIVVMSPEPSAFEAIIEHQLEPEIYNLEILQQFMDFLEEGQIDYPIHIKVDTGMHRLGFEESEIDRLLLLLKDGSQVKVQSIFSHLVASDDPKQDDFTKLQLASFSAIALKVTATLGYQPIKHISNTAGITRLPEAQFDMVRVGIGLYGFDAALKNNKGLQTVTTLKTTVTQVRSLKANESVGYSRRGIMQHNGNIATVKIGYADGYSRMFGNGVGKMLIQGKPVPTIGSICMDMSMLDVTGLDVKAGDEVVVFNDVLTIEMLAKQIYTIPYEILTNISQRVKRVYFYE
jgi:alanine racemase